MKRLAVVIDGWHYPLQPYATLAKLMIIPDGWSVDLFCVMHRVPDVADAIQIRHEVETSAAANASIYQRFDKNLYDTFANCEALLELGYTLSLKPNVAGDIVFLQQWLESNDWRRYDIVLNLHDDTLIIDDRLFQHVISEYDLSDWLVIANGIDPSVGPGYVRGSFEFYNRKLFLMVDGKLPIGATSLDRTGKTDSTYGRDHRYLADWNHLTEPLVEFLKEHRGLVKYLGRGYRVSPYAIEGERGFIHRNNAIPELFNQSMDEYIASGKYDTNLLRK